MPAVYGCLGGGEDEGAPEFGREPVSCLRRKSRPVRRPRSPHDLHGFGSPRRRAPSPPRRRPVRAEGSGTGGRYAGVERTGSGDGLWSLSGNTPVRRARGPGRRERMEDSQRGLAGVSAVGRRSRDVSLPPAKQSRPLCPVMKRRPRRQGPPAGSFPALTPGRTRSKGIHSPVENVFAPRAPGARRRA